MCPGGNHSPSWVSPRSQQMGFSRTTIRRVLPVQTGIWHISNWPGLTGQTWYSADFSRSYFPQLEVMGFACLLTQTNWLHQAPKSAGTFSHKKNTAGLERVSATSAATLPGICRRIPTGSSNQSRQCKAAVIWHGGTPSLLALRHS